MLVGKELLDKARSLSNRPEDEIARGCGYVGPSGRVLRKSFYKALVEAKGYKLRTTNRPGSRSSRGPTSARTSTSSLGRRSTSRRCSRCARSCCSSTTYAPPATALARRNGCWQCCKFWHCRMPRWQKPQPQPRRRRHAQLGRALPPHRARRLKHVHFTAKHVRQHEGMPELWLPAPMSWSRSA